MSALEITLRDIDAIKRGNFGKVVYFTEEDRDEGFTRYDFVVIMSGKTYRANHSSHEADYPSNPVMLHEVRAVQTMVTIWERVQ